MNVKLTKEQMERVQNTSDIFNIMQQVLLREHAIRRMREHFWILGLSPVNKLMFVELLSLGARNRVSITPPDAFRMAIYKLAPKVIFVHNHPSGIMIPSDADTNLTNRMLKAGWLIDIEVIDHLIISETRYFSFADAGIMEQLRRDRLYTLVDAREEERKAAKEKLELEAEVREREKEKLLDLASRMLEKGATIEFVKEVTSLPIQTVRRLKKEQEED